MFTLSLFLSAGVVWPHRNKFAFAAYSKSTIYDSMAVWMAGIPSLWHRRSLLRLNANLFSVRATNCALKRKKRQETMLLEAAEHYEKRQVELGWSQWFFGE
jgi:hypothetical protein